MVIQLHNCKKFPYFSVCFFIKINKKMNLNVIFSIFLIMFGCGLNNLILEQIVRYFLLNFT